ncbi:MAG TPA: GNAT family N-acetyltransferase [bacterium]|nr:GNAT family N-acetyltransferase [bacterium]
MDDDVVIRPLTALEELRAVERLQREIWGMPERDVVPVHHLLAASRAGGAVLGAIDRHGRLVGFCYGFIGWRDGQMLFYSHMAGVAAAWRGREIGFRLKQAQRAAALAQGLDRMIWTFDPLLARNAHFNLHKLGARARRYYVHYYGEMDDDLNRGVDSDRLEVDWWLRDPRVEALLRGAPPPPAPAGALRRIAVPADFDALRRTDPIRAQAERCRTREAFQRAFAEGYEAVDFVDGAYLLARRADGDR